MKISLATGYKVRLDYQPNYRCFYCCKGHGH